MSFSRSFIKNTLLPKIKHFKNSGLVNKKHMRLVCTSEGNTTIIKRYNNQIRLFSSNSNNGKDYASTEDYLSSLGYTDPKLQDGMKSALKMAFGSNVSVANLKSIGVNGLGELSKSVKQELLKNSGNIFVGTVHIHVPHHNFSFDIQMEEGHTFMNAATEGIEREVLGEYLECSCGGFMSCASCHVILDEESFAKLSPPTEAECDMLDLAFEPTETSRLGCQVKMSKDLDGMNVTIPAGVNNLWS